MGERKGEPGRNSNVMNEQTPSTGASTTSKGIGKQTLVGQYAVASGGDAVPSVGRPQDSQEKAEETTAPDAARPNLKSVGKIPRLQLHNVPAISAETRTRGERTHGPTTGTAASTIPADRTSRATSTPHAGSQSSGGSTSATPEAASASTARHDQGSTSAATTTSQPSTRSSVARAALDGAFARSGSAATQDAAKGIAATVSAEGVKIGQAFATKRAALQTTAESTAQSILATAATEHAATLGALQERGQRMRAVFASARAGVHAAQAAQVALARSDANAAMNRLRTGSAGVVGQIRAAAHAEEMRMQTAAETAVHNVAASGTTLRGEIWMYPIGNLSAQPDEAAAIQVAIGQAKQQAAGAAMHADQAGGQKLRSTAAQNGEAFASSASDLAAQVSAKLPEAEQAIHAGGDAAATLIEKMAGSQLAAIDIAERQIMVKLDEAKQRAGNILTAGKLAAGRVRTQVGAQIARLSAQESAAQGQLHAAGTQAATQLGQHRDASRAQANTFAAQVSTSLQGGAAQILARLEQSSSSATSQLAGVGSTFAGVIRDRRDRALAGLDDAIGATEGALKQRLGELINQCASIRAEATTAYAAADAQLVASAQPGIQNARDAWRSKADEFIATARTYEAEHLAKHAQVRAGLPTKMAEVVRDTTAYLHRSTARKVWDGVKDGLGVIAHGLVIFVVGVLVVAAALLVIFGTAFAGLAVALAVVIVGAVMLAVGLVTNLVNRLRMLWNNEWPWWAKILGIPAAFGVAVGDMIGLSQITESIRGREPISDRELSTEERSARMTEGIFQVITFGVVREVTRRLRGPRTGGETPAARQNSRSPEAGETKGEAANDAIIANDARTANEVPTEANTSTDEATSSKAPGAEQTATASTSDAEPISTGQVQPRPLTPREKLEARKKASLEEQATKEASRRANRTLEQELADTEFRSDAKAQAKEEGRRFGVGSSIVEEAMKAYQAIFEETYRKSRRTDPEAKSRANARKAASQRMMEIIVEAATKEAPQRARADMLADRQGRGVPDAFKNDDAIQQQAFRDVAPGPDGNSAAGQAARELSPELENKTPSEIEAIVQARGGKRVPAVGEHEVKTNAVDAQTRQPLLNADGTPQSYPQIEYLFPDGSRVRIKPKGDIEFSQKPMYSVEMLRADAQRSGTPQDNVAFKFDVHGRPVPKGPADIRNPYPHNSPPYLIYQETLLEAGHLRAGNGQSTSPSTSTSEVSPSGTREN